ncbi:MAG TPA: hypothetical protein G4N98_03835 [Thermoflexia bacterium]|nr:hypothetical protein [Thermoflexia bacterium]
MNEKRIEMLVGALRDKTDKERDEFFEAMDISDRERGEVRSLLIEEQQQIPSGVLSAEQLPDSEHFKTLVPLVRRGKALLFIGAGVSQEVGMPSTIQLFDALRAEARGYGTEISRDTSFREAARKVERLMGRQGLVNLIREEINDACRKDPPPHRLGAYRLLPVISSLTRRLVTTNWDDLLLRALQEAGESAVEITKSTQLSWLPTMKNAIIKLHGGVEDPESMIITETDYAIAASQIIRRTTGTLWGYVSSLLSQYSFIFLGYSLEDPDFRLLRDMVKSSQGIWRESIPSFMVVPLSQERQADVERYGELRVIPTTATNFLQALFSETGEFANREDERDRVFRRDSKPFIEFYGPFGLGKSALLDEIEAQAEAEGWRPRQILRVNLGRLPDGEPRREKISGLHELLGAMEQDLDFTTSLGRSEDLVDELRGKKRFCLLVDGVERGQNEELVFLFANVIAPVVREMNQSGMRSKLVIAGRLPLSNLPYAFRRDLDSRRLRPLQRSAVGEMARKFLLAKDSDSQERFSAELLTDIVEISGGHPGFIKFILRALTGDEEWYLPSRLTEVERKRYVSHFSKIIDEQLRWQGVKAVYEKQLSVYRWVNREILKELQVPVEETIKVLTEEYILMPDFTFDPVIQHIKMLQLRYESPDEYQRAHKAARDSFRNGIDELSFPAQREYIVEWLFHTAYLLLVECPDDLAERRERLLEQIQSLPPYRARRGISRGNPGAELEAQVMKDDELLRVLGMCVEENKVDRILDLLKEKEVKNV